MDSNVSQATVVLQPTIDVEKALQRIALFYEDGTPLDVTDPIVKGDKGDKGDTGAAGDSGITGAAITTATAIGTAAKTTTSDEPADNSIVPIIFTNGNSAETPTMAFNGGSARAMKLGGTASAAAKLTVAAGGVVLFWFDGTVLHQFGVVS